MGVLRHRAAATPTGSGRSGRSKVLPMVLLGLMLLPALILVGVLVQARTLLDLDEQIVAYSTYPITTQLLISVFVAAQAPALISRDLRFRTHHALPRPTRCGARSYVLVRLASLTAATFVLVGAPLLLLYVGGLLADLPVGPRDRALPRRRCSGPLLLAACLSGLAALVSALTVRRGLAVAAVIVVLVVSYTVVSTIQGISDDVGNETVGEVAGLFSPYTLVNGVQVFLFDSPEATADAAERRPRWASSTSSPRCVMHRSVAHRRHAGSATGEVDEPMSTIAARPRVAVVPQRRRGQRRLDDDRPGGDRAARPQRRREVHADRADVRLPGTLDRHGHAGRRAAVAQRVGLPEDRAGPGARGAVRLPHRAAVRGRQRRAARAGRRRAPRRSGRSRWSR